MSLYSDIRNSKEDNRFIKPTPEQVAWVFQKLIENSREGGSFRYLIYDRMGMSPSAYQMLYKAGGMEIVNKLNSEKENIEDII